MVVFGVLCFFFYKSYDNTVHLIKKKFLYVYVLYSACSDFGIYSNKQQAMSRI